MKYRIINLTSPAHNSVSVVSIIIRIIYLRHPSNNTATMEGEELDITIIIIIITVFPLTCFSYYF